MPITIHGAGGSPFVRKVRVALAEKGVPYELNPIIPFGPRDELFKMNPLGPPLFLVVLGQVPWRAFKLWQTARERSLTAE